jgi:hypothetical protein
MSAVHLFAGSPERTKTKPGRRGSIACLNRFPSPAAAGHPSWMQHLSKPQEG